MVKRAQVRLIVVIAVFIGVGFLALGYRLLELQVLRHEEFKAKADTRVRETLVEPRRGDILDIKGNVLATTAYRKVVWADPSKIEAWHDVIARALAPLLDRKPAEIEGKLRDNVRVRRDGTTRTNMFVVLADKIPVERWEAIQQALVELEQQLQQQASVKEKKEDLKLSEAIQANDQPVRVYPQKRLASHIVGFASPEQRAIGDLSISEAKTPPVHQIIPWEGMELVMNDKLSGAHGWRVTEYGTHRKRRVELVTQRTSDVAARDGLNVYLTIDTYIQDIVEKAIREANERHNPISISGIVVRPRTGEILSLACLPDYDPNNPDGEVVDARRNRVISDIAEPGSTFKIVVTAGALNENVVKLTDRFDCEKGRFFYGGRWLRDHHAYSILSVEEIITKSSNIGAAKIGMQLGEKKLYDYIRTFGFGTRTGIPLIGEVPGIVHPVDSWRKVALAQIPMGHGIATTRLQMAMAMAAIANHGQLMRPMLIDRLEDQDHNVVVKYAPQKVGQIISERAARDMVRALKTVVSKEGTAPRAALENYTVAGKTGTAQKVDNKTYSNEKFVSSFIGFFPADNPEVCIGITLDEPRNKKLGYYGGAVAGPIFKQIAEGIAKYLSIPQDRFGTNAPPVLTAAGFEDGALLTGREP